MGCREWYAKWFEFGRWRLALWFNSGEGFFVGAEFHASPDPWLIVKLGYIGFTVGRS